MKNVVELRDELKEIYGKVKAGTMGIKEAKSLIATVNAMMKSAALEMEHSKMIGLKEPIEFLQNPNQKK